MSVLDAPVLADPEPSTNRASSAERDLTSVLVLVAGGDQEAFAELYRTSSTYVFTVALRVLRNRAQADEVTQEVYLQVWQQARRFDPTKGTVWGWLTTMAHRRAVDRVRTATAAADRDHRYSALEPDRERDEVWDQISTQHDVAVVRAALARLTVKQREAILLAYFCGHTTTEIATTLGVAASTVKTRIRDGVTSLGKLLQPGHGASPR